MTAFVLKLIAITTMLIDHSSFLFFGQYFSWMRCVGRIAFPIFAFQICEGYIHTKNLKKYYLRLIIFALISELPYVWFTFTFLNGEISINIIFTLILGLLSINIYDYFQRYAKDKSKNIQLYYMFLSLYLVFLISIIAEKLGLDYGYFGVLLIFLFYLFRNNKVLLNLSAILLTFIFHLPKILNAKFHINSIYLFLCTLIPLIFINLYNGKKGKDLKWLFYIFYPLHLMIICLIYYLR